MPRILLAVVAALLSVAAGATTAGALPDPVGPQHVQTGGTFPLPVPGQHPAARIGDHLRHGQHLVSRRVTLLRGEARSFWLTCPAGTVDRGVAISAWPGMHLHFHTRHPYAGFRHVNLSIHNRDIVHRHAAATVYELCS